MLTLKINFQTKDLILESIDGIAEKIFRDITLKINSSEYRIIDSEFYIYTESSEFRDPHTYDPDLQKEFCKLYLHASGIDLTIGDGNNHGGILIRGVIKLNKDISIENRNVSDIKNGPQNVATELFANLFPLNVSIKNEITLIESQGQNLIHYPSEYVKTKRVGLRPKKNDIEDYFMNIPLRYIVLYPKFFNKNQTIQGGDGIRNKKIINGDMTVDEARKILNQAL